MASRKKTAETAVQGTRPDPDAVLERIRSNEAAGKRGKLTLFFGMAAGVGKTYAMLQEARAAKASGADVIIALAETHGRKETENLLEGLERLPPSTMSYRGVALEEPDVEAVLDRSPSVVVVDELAHTNAPGSRHVKRCQDVMELLDRGISVWTALNIQHVESYADVVESMTGTVVRERVPDTVLDRADEIRVVDLAPEDLIKRLQEGKVHTGESSRVAIANFFRPRNLGALRELTLRYAAQRAERALKAYSRTEEGMQPISNPGSGILVAVGPAPSSAYLVRWARRAAFALRTGWIALHVQTGSRFTDAEIRRLEENLALARKLGAETVVVQGSDIAGTVIENARSRCASMIVIGRSGLSPLGFLPRRATVSDRIVREAGPIDVAVIQDQARPRPRGILPGLRTFMTASPRQYALLGASFAAITIAGSLLLPLIRYRSLALLFLGAVLSLSFIAKPGLVAVFAVISALGLNFFFIPPLFTFAIASVEDLILFLTYFLVAAVTGGLVASLRARERLLLDRDRQNAVLLAASQRLGECRSPDEAAIEAARLIEEHMGRDAAVLIAEEGGPLPERGYGKAGASLDTCERATSTYSMRENAICGAGTDTLPSSRLRHLPVEAGGRTYGVIAVQLDENAPWTRKDDILLLSLGRTLALAVERARSDAKGRRTALALESERLSALLLDSVSHELRTPLTTILGSLTTLQDEALMVSVESRRSLVREAIGATERLDRLVGDILSYNRIEAGTITLKMEPILLGDLAQEGRRQSTIAYAERKLDIRIETPTRIAVVDSGLVSQAIANLLRNAAEYAKRPGPIELAFAVESSCLTICVTDPGPGIPPEEVSRMFERFMRGKAAPNGGLGLGLAICKGIAEAHGGAIGAETLSDGRFRMEMRIPDAVVAR